MEIMGFATKKAKMFIFANQIAMRRMRRAALWLSWWAGCRALGRGVN